jgi:hypothetical protein
MHFDFLKAAEMLEKAFGPRLGPTDWRLMVIVFVLGFFGGAAVGAVHGYKLIVVDLRGSETTNGPQTKPPSSQPKPPEAPPPTSSSPPPSSPFQAPFPHHLPPGEADRKLGVINSAADIFGPGMQTIVEDGPSLVSGAWNAFKDPKNHPTYAKDLRAYVERVRSIVSKADELRNQHPEYSDISSAIDDHYPLEASADNFRQAYELMTVYLSPSIEGQHFSILINPFSSPFERHIRKFSEWRRGVQNKLIQIRNDVLHN